jgi:hypothetical protein
MATQGLDMTARDLPELLPLPEWCLDDDRAAYVLAGMSGPQYRNDMHQYASDCIAALAGAGAVASADPVAWWLESKAVTNGWQTRYLWWDEPGEGIRRSFNVRPLVFGDPAPVAVGVDEAWRTDLPAMDQSDGGNPPLFSSKLVLVSLADGEVTTDRSMRFPSNPDDKPFWFVYGKKVLAWRPMPEPFTAALEAKPHA